MACCCTPTAPPRRRGAAALRSAPDACAAPGGATHRRGATQRLQGGLGHGAARGCARLSALGSRRRQARHPRAPQRLNALRLALGFGFGSGSGSGSGQTPVLMLTLAPEAGLGADLTAYAAAPGLSVTETRVLQRLALGESSARAATALGLRAITVRHHCAPPLCAPTPRACAARPGTRAWTNWCMHWCGWRRFRRFHPTRLASALGE